MNFLEKAQATSIQKDKSAASLKAAKERFKRNKERSGALGTQPSEREKAMSRLADKLASKKGKK